MTSLGCVLLLVTHDEQLAGAVADHHLALAVPAAAVAS